MQDTRARLFPTDFPPIRRGELTSLQVNLGYLCNQSCSHCHVNAGPQRTELMDLATVNEVLALVDRSGVRTVDLTGGAPEMNPNFRYLVESLRKRGLAVIDRCNLTILSEPGYQDLAAFLADQSVQVVASLPCYSADNVAQQRGKGVFELSIAGLQMLNALGYGRGALTLDLVYNPNGAFLPPAQASLQQDYTQHLFDEYGIVFNQLLTITNMPISRFGAQLLAKNDFERYLQLLKDNFSDANLAAVMCRSLISVDWQGYVYDCDFNQMLALPARNPSLIASDQRRLHVRDLRAEAMNDGPIAIGEHCYGCTAGQGSSCGGALV